MEHTMQRIDTLPIHDISHPFDETLCRQAAHALESGQVILLPSLPFLLKEHERKFLTPKAVNGRSKNISYRAKTDCMQGDAYQGRLHDELKAMMHRFSVFSSTLLQHLFPHYASTLTQARTSYRPVEAATRTGMSYRKDDRRLHVDAFPSSPNQGGRILRVFSNINPNGEPRVWQLGDSFENVAKQFLPSVKRPFVFNKYFLKALGITKSIRTDYDAYMLQIHDKMKADEAYQKNAPQEEVQLPAGSTWIVFTDQASHAAKSGQYCLEQTFHLPRAGMVYPERSPLAILESIVRKQLI